MSEVARPLSADELDVADPIHPSRTGRLRYGYYARGQGRPIDGPPTPKQLEILRFCAKRRSDRGCFPALREICNEFGFSSTHAAWCHMQLLERKGLVTPDVKNADGVACARTRTITSAGYDAIGFHVSSGPATGVVEQPVKCLRCGRAMFGVRARVGHRCLAEDLRA